MSGLINGGEAVGAAHVHGVNGHVAFHSVKMRFGPCAVLWKQETMNRKHIQAIAIHLVFVAGLPYGLLAQDQAANKKFAERLSVTVVVVDPDGAPVEGASVEPTGVVARNQPSAVYSWVDDQPDLVKGLVTNEKGEVTVTWPVRLGEDFEPISIQLSVRHPAFVVYTRRHSIDESPFRVTLERGFQAAVSAVVAGTGAAIPKEELYAKTNDMHSPDWTLKENGTMVSPVFGADENSFRLIQIVDGRAVRFSDLIHVDLDERSKFLFRDLQMHAAVALRGKLDEKVPRPVKNGRVVASAVSIREEDRPKYHTAWNWMVFGDIAEDGTFKLDGLPADAPFQIIATCDGWANEPLTDDEFNSRFPSQKGNRMFFAAPQLVPERELSDVIVSMQPTGSCKVKVIDEDGKPIPGAIVARSLNFVFFHGETVSGFNSRNSSAERLMRIRNPDLTEATLARETAEYEAEIMRNQITTDENGLATVSNLSGPLFRSFAVHPEYQAESGDHQAMFQANLESGKESEATVILYRAATTGRKDPAGDGDGKGK